jgi:hypothetical protein
VTRRDVVLLEKVETIQILLLNPFVFPGEVHHARSRCIDIADGGCEKQVKKKTIRHDAWEGEPLLLLGEKEVKRVVLTLLV